MMMNEQRRDDLLCFALHASRASMIDRGFYFFI